MKKSVDICFCVLYYMSCVENAAENKRKRHHIECQHITGCGSVWLERLVWDQEVAGSNPVTPTFLCGCSSMVEH